MAVRITSRDIEILRWINRLGFLNIDQIATHFHISKPTAYARLRKLVKGQYLTHEYCLHSEPGVYRVTRLGADIADDPIPPLKELRLGSFKHDTVVASVMIRLATKYNCEVTTERELRRNTPFKKRERKTHFPDGLLNLPDKKVAIEVELTSKSSWRLKDIIFQHHCNFTYDEVWYFCGSKAVEKKVREHSGSTDVIQVFDLDIIGNSLNK